MASTYTSNSGIEKPGTGEQSGTWGSTTNLNFDIIDRIVSGVGSITLTGTTHTLTTSDGTLSDGMFKVLVLGGSPSGTNTITISPNDAEKLYFVKNDSGQSVIFTQGSGSNVTVADGATKIIFADGAGSGAAVTDFTNSLALNATSLSIGGTAVTATAAELNYTDVTTLGTVEASKAVTADSNADVLFGDNDKLLFGAGSDLQIYHDGSSSRIVDAGTGNLLVQADELVIRNAAGNETKADYTTDGAVNLYHDNVVKLSTTSYGIDISGSAVADTDTSGSHTGSQTPDFDTYQNFVWTLTGNTTLANPTTEKVGQTGFFVFVQDATGSRVLSLGTDYETAGGAGITLTTTANAVDIVPYVVKASNSILLGTPQLEFS